MNPPTPILCVNAGWCGNVAGGYEDHYAVVCYEARFLGTSMVKETRGQTLYLWKAIWSQGQYPEREEAERAAIEYALSHGMIFRPTARSNVPVRLRPDGTLIPEKDDIPNPRKQSKGRGTRRVIPDEEYR